LDSEALVKIQEAIAFTADVGRDLERLLREPNEAGARRRYISATVVASMDVDSGT